MIYLERYDFVFKYIHESLLIYDFEYWYNVDHAWTDDAAILKLESLGIIKTKRFKADHDSIEGVYIPEDLTTKDIELYCMGLTRIDKAQKYKDYRASKIAVENAKIPRLSHRQKMIHLATLTVWLLLVCVIFDIPFLRYIGLRA